MSSAQKKMYVLDQLEGAETAYNMSDMMLLEGYIDVERFKDVARQIVKRHETLRTSFHMIEGELLQRVHADIEFDITYIEAKEDTIKNIEEEFISPFDLSKAPLLRVSLVKTGEDRHVMMFDTHHIISIDIASDII